MPAARTIGQVGAFSRDTSPFDSMPVVTRPSVSAGPDVVEILGLRIGQRLQQDGVQRAEDRRRRADAERERHDGGQRKRRRATETPKRESQVLEQRSIGHS